MARSITIVEVMDKLRFIIQVRYCEMDMMSLLRIILNVNEGGPSDSIHIASHETCNN